MKYLCLVYVEEKVLNEMPKPERQSLSDEAMAFCDALQKNGQLIAASPLHPPGRRPGTARSCRRLP